MSHRARALVLACLLLAGCTSSKDASSKASPKNPGADLSAIVVTPLGSAPALKLGAAQKTPMVVNVWATWCVPCRKEMPAFEQVASAYADKVRFVGINLGDGESQAKQFVADTGVTFDQYLDSDMTAQAALAIASMPATVFVRADGTIAATHNGALDEAALREQIKQKLGVE